MAHTYDKGDTVRASATFTDADGLGVDPGTVTFKVLDPSGNEASYVYGGVEVIKTATGIYYIDILIDESGTWHFRCEGTGTDAAASESYFSVRVSKFD